LAELVTHVVYAKCMQSWPTVSPNGVSVGYVIAAGVGTVEYVERSIR